MQRVILGMSGGVDSSVAAILLAEQGYSCSGAYIMMNDADHSADIADAAACCASLGIPFETLDAREVFEREVVMPFIGAYEAGYTPSPCVICNARVKIPTLVSRACAVSADKVATGHYARIEQTERGYAIRKARDAAKDQSYMLYRLTQAELSRLVLPLGEYTKREIRELAAEHGLAASGKRDSQDICFVPNGDYVAFMQEKCGHEYPSGDFLDISGHVLGRHSGAVRYTIGQRKGLGIALGARAFVLEKDMENNTVTLGREEELYASIFTVRDANFLFGEAPSGAVSIKTRYNSREKAGCIYPLNEGRFRVELQVPDRAITHGQSAVFYDGDLLLGGGIIESVVKA